MRAGFDVERNQFQWRTITGGRFQFAIQQGAVALRVAAKQHRRRDEALHHVALGRENVGLVDIDTA
jgi:hypothetical protein